MHQSRLSVIKHRQDSSLAVVPDHNKYHVMMMRLFFKWVIYILMYQVAYQAAEEVLALKAIIWI